MRPERLNQPSADPKEAEILIREEKRRGLFAPLARVSRLDVYVCPDCGERCLPEWFERWLKTNPLAVVLWRRANRFTFDRIQAKEALAHQIEHEIDRDILMDLFAFDVASFDQAP